MLARDREVFDQNTGQLAKPVTDYTCIIQLAKLQQDLHNGYIQVDSKNDDYL